jgi:hypothetical protein
VFPFGVFLAFHRSHSRLNVANVNKKFPIGNLWRQTFALLRILGSRGPLYSRSGTFRSSAAYTDPLPFPAGRRSR